MTVRDFLPEDLPLLMAWKDASGFDYQLPELTEHAFLANKVVVDGKQPVAAAGARLTVEIFGWVDKDWGTPAMKLEAMRLLHREVGRELKQMDLRKQVGENFIRLRISDAHAWLPVQIAKTFRRRLMRTFGWVQQEWPCFCKQV